jgi:hypothetical protein
MEFLPQTVLCSDWLEGKVSAATWGNLFVLCWAIDKAIAEAGNLARHKRKV